MTEKLFVNDKLLLPKCYSVCPQVKCVSNLLMGIVTFIPLRTKEMSSAFVIFIIFIFYFTKVGGGAKAPTPPSA